MLSNLLLSIGGSKLWEAGYRSRFEYTAVEFTSVTEQSFFHSSRLWSPNFAEKGTDLSKTDSWLQLNAPARHITENIHTDFSDEIVHTLFIELNFTITNSKIKTRNE